MQPTIDDLKAAYKRTSLKRQGISFLQAMECIMLRRCLTRIAESALKLAEAQGNPAPDPLVLVRGRYAD